MTPQQRAKKRADAILSLRQARRLLDELHQDYRAAAPLTSAETAEWRELLDLLGPLDALHEAGRLERA